MFQLKRERARIYDMPWRRVATDDGPLSSMSTRHRCTEWPGWQAVFQLTYDDSPVRASVRAGSGSDQNYAVILVT